MGLRFTKVALGVALLAVGLLAASPFLCRRLVGTGEAYNYSLSVADAVVQMRHGIVPPLAGQTEYAFNGRIHPLRNAPYLYYLAGAIDLASFHRLAFWEIQNASVVFSFVAAAFACFIGLRWGADCPRSLAFFLTCAYVLSPALLYTAHSLNLLMTVHAAPFVPLAVGACVRGSREPSFSTDAWMAAALALAWLAHPPVALWLTGGVMLAKAVSFAGRPGWRPLASTAAAAVLAFLLAGFGFASAMTLNSDLGLFQNDPAVWSRFEDTIVANLRAAVPGCLLPVSRTGNSYTDLQFGYAAWGLLALTLALLLWRGSRRDEWEWPTRFAAAGMCAVTGLLLVLTLPVPVLTHGLWAHVPTAALQMTFAWPMQRLYLVAIGFTVFGAALVVPGRWRELQVPRWVAPAALALGLAWILYEAKPLIMAGVGNRRSQEVTEASYRPSNLNLTITSYAFVGPPPTFVNGAADPSLEFRLLRNGEEEVASDFSSALATAPVVAKGSFQVSGTPHAPAVASQTVVLAPGHRYLMTFAFKAAPFEGWIEFVGPSLSRSYNLPSAGESKGFGMMEGQRRTLPIWTDSDKPEQVRVAVGVTDGTRMAGHTVDLADFTLQDVNRDALPIRFKGFLPLRFEVDAPQEGCTVETPQRYLSGYEATVDGRKVAVHMSPWRNVMVGVPPGHSTVEIRYAGPLLAHAAFWITAFCWAGFFAWRMTGSRTPVRPLHWVAGNLRRFFAFVWRHRVVFASAAVLTAALTFYGERHTAQRVYLGAVGPIQVEFTLPYGKTGLSQPLLATGHAQAGVVVSITPLDERRVRLGADVWGTLYQSQPIELDYSQAHTLVVSDSALFPSDHPRVKALAPSEKSQLRRELRVELDGFLAIDANAFAFEARPSEIHVGETPFGSTSGPRFLGEILGVRRLPIPRMIGMPWGSRAHLRVRFPEGRQGATEPLLSIVSGTGTLSYSVTYLSDRRLRITASGPGEAAPRSTEVDSDPGRSHGLDFWPCESLAPGPAFDFACDFDGAHILGGTRPVVPTSRPLLVCGVVPPSPVVLQPRFSGPEMDLNVTSDGTSTGSVETSGPAHLILTLPEHKDGRHEPILTTGRTGAGDLVYFFYEDDRHVRIGFDHWGVGGVLTEPIAVDYRAIHDIWISEGSLYPDPADDASWRGVDPAARKRLKSLVEVVFDGKTVISQPSPTYPSTQEEVTFAGNRIGGSTADPEFSGIVHFSERTGPVLPPGPKL